MMDSWAVDIDRMRAVQALPARHRIFAVTLDQGTSCAYNPRQTDGDTVGPHFQAGI